MSNKDNYKKAMDQIYASEELKEKAFENAKYAKNNNFTILKFLSTCAAVLILFFVGVNYINTGVDLDKTNIAKDEEDKKIEEIIIANAELPRFESMEQLKQVLKTNSFAYKGIFAENAESIADGAVLNSTAQAVEKSVATESFEDTARKESVEELSADFSTTNTQVENVDEADIVKTDGEYIYYVSRQKLYIVKADTLEVVSGIKIKTDNERFSISEIFLKGDKVVLLGNGYVLEEPMVEANEEEKMVSNTVRVSTTQTAKAIVYDITDRENPEKLRKMVKDTKAKSTDYEAPEDVDTLCDRTTPYAQNWQVQAEKLWKKR